MVEETNLSELLRDRKLKATPIRLEVLGIIKKKSTATAYSQIQSSLQDFDRVTLYRTLNAFEEKGLIHKALVNEHETFYAMCSHNCSSQTHSHKHIHFKCNRCGGVSCVPSAEPLRLSVEGYQIQSFEVEAEGICPACLT